MSDFSQNTNDNAIFDRLVDGELTPDERQQLLASLDSTDNGWRRCALAFLEAQSWGHQLKQYVSQPQDEPTTQLASSPTHSSALKAFALAAGIMLAFTVGWLVRPSSIDDPTSGRIVAIDTQDIQTPDEVPNNALPQDTVSDRDAVTLYVRDTSGQNQRLRVPLIEAANLGGQADDELLALPAEVRQQLRDEGYDLKRRRRFAPMFFEQNERVVPMVVPVDDTYIVPVSRPVY